MAKKKVSEKSPDHDMVEITLGGLRRGEDFPKGYFGNAPDDLFGPRSIRDPLEHYSPCYMDDMFGAGVTEPLHGLARPGSGLGPERNYDDELVPTAPVSTGEEPQRGPDGKQRVIYDPKDDRVTVLNTLPPPHRCVCRLEIVMQNGAIGFGTGWFAAANIVVTAGHCLYPKNGPLPAEIYVTPGLNGASAPYQAQLSTVIRVPRQWSQNYENAFDFGVIVLPNKHMGNKTGWFGYASTKDSHLDNMRINSLGYPSDRGNNIQISCPGRIRDFDGNYLWHSVDTREGQSGSPIFHKSPSGKRTVIGIHTDADGKFNRAVRISPLVFKQISDAIWDNA